MNLPRDLVNLVREHYIYAEIAKDTRFIEELPLEKVDWIRKYKLYHLAKLSSYTGVHEEDASASLNWAVAQGYIDICEWIDENTFYTFDCNFGNHPQILAARGGHLQMMKWLKSHAITPNYAAFSVALAHGHQHILDWLDQYFG